MDIKYLKQTHFLFEKIIQSIYIYQSLPPSNRKLKELYNGKENTISEL